MTTLYDKWRSDSEIDWPVLIVYPDQRHYLVYEDGREEQVNPKDLKVNYPTFIKKKKP